MPKSKCEKKNLVCFFVAPSAVIKTLHQKRQCIVLNNEAINL